MELKIEITVDNAAFEENFQLELKRILDKIGQLERPLFLSPQVILDSNGNKVGQWSMM